MALSISDLKKLFQRNQSYLFQNGEINTPLLQLLHSLAFALFFAAAIAIINQYFAPKKA